MDGDGDTGVEARYRPDGALRSHRRSGLPGTVDRADQGIEGLLLLAQGRLRPDELGVHVSRPARRLHPRRRTWRRRARSCQRHGPVGSPCDASTLPSPRHAAFVDDTDDHETVSTTGKVKTQIGDKSLEQYLFDWIKTGVDTVCVDVSGGRTPDSGTAAAWGACP